MAALGIQIEHTVVGCKFVVDVGEVLLQDRRPFFHPFFHQDRHTEGDGHDQKHKQQDQEIQKPFTRIHADKEHKPSRDQQNGRDIPGQNIERICFLHLRRFPIDLAAGTKSGRGFFHAVPHILYAVLKIIGGIIPPVKIPVQAPLFITVEKHGHAKLCGECLCQCLPLPMELQNDRDRAISFRCIQGVDADPALLCFKQ